MCVAYPSKRERINTEGTEIPTQNTDKTSDDVLAEEDGDGFSDIDVRSVGSDDQEAVGGCQRDDVSGTLPAQRLDLRRCSAPFDPRGEKMREAWLFVQRFSQPRFD